MPQWLGGVSESIRAAAEAMLAVSGLIGGVLMPAALVARLSPARVDASASQDSSDIADLAMSPFASEVLRVETEVRSALREFEATSALVSLRLEIALESHLQVRADKRALGAVLRLLIRHAVSQASRRVLVSANRHGGRVQICVTDDGAGAGRKLQQSRLRDAERLIALQGGTIEVRARDGAGTTVMLRMPEPVTGSVPTPTAGPTAIPTDAGQTTPAERILSTSPGL